MVELEISNSIFALIQVWLHFKIQHVIVLLNHVGGEESGFTGLGWALMLELRASDCQIDVLFLFLGVLIVFFKSLALLYFFRVDRAHNDFSVVVR